MLGSMPAAIGMMSALAARHTPSLYGEPPLEPTLSESQPPSSTPPPNLIVSTSPSCNPTAAGSPESANEERRGPCADGVVDE